MATLAVQAVLQSGLAPTYSAAAAGGDVFPNSTGKVMFHVKNGGTGSVNVTFNSQTPCDQGFDHDLVVAVPNGSERMIGPFQPTRFNNSSGQVEANYSGVTSVTVAAISLT